MIFLLYLKISLILKQQGIQLIYISLYMVIGYSHCSLLIPICALYGFWLLRYKKFCSNTPSIFCDVSLIFQVFITTRTAQKSYYLCIIFCCCQSNYLFPISALYGFWLLSNKCFCRYTPPLFCDFSLILKVLINIWTHRKSNYVCTLSHHQRTLA